MSPRIYSRFRDVKLTLEGHYGARASRSDPTDQFSSALHPLDQGQHSAQAPVAIDRRSDVPHDGTIRVINRPEGGALAELTLPSG